MEEPEYIVCPECNGEGEVEVLISHAHQEWSPERGTSVVDDVFGFVPCETCDGTGEVLLTY